MNAEIMTRGKESSKMSTKAPQGWGVDDVYDLDISTNLGPSAKLQG